MDEQKFSVVGKVTPRKDGVARVTGQEQYTVDIRLPRMLYGRAVCSPYAHARIKSIDTSAAEAMGAVVLTFEDIPQLRYNERIITVEWALHKDHYVLADKVRRMGEAVAAVAAETEELAEKAARAVVVEYEPLPVVLDPLEALKPGAEPLYDTVMYGDKEIPVAEQHRLHPRCHRRRRGQGLRRVGRLRRGHLHRAQDLPRPDGAQVGRLPPRAGRRDHGVGHPPIDPQRPHRARADLRHPAQQGQRQAHVGGRHLWLEHPDELRRADRGRPGAQSPPPGQAVADPRRGHARPRALRHPGPHQDRREERRHADRRRDGPDRRYRGAHPAGLFVPGRVDRLAGLALPLPQRALPRPLRLHQQGPGLRHAGIRQPAGHLRRRVAHGRRSPKSSAWTRSSCA